MPQDVLSAFILHPCWTLAMKPTYYYSVFIFCFAVRSRNRKIQTWNFCKEDKKYPIHK